jgi:hypothetical protein
MYPRIRFDQVLWAQNAFYMKKPPSVAGAEPAAFVGPRVRFDAAGDLAQTWDKLKAVTGYVPP